MKVLLRGGFGLARVHCDTMKRKFSNFEFKWSRRFRILGFYL